MPDVTESDAPIATASSPDSTAEARPTPNWFDAFIWGLWPWMAWLFPALLFACFLNSSSSGWESLFILGFSPVLVPAYALINLIPRLIVRKNQDLPHGSAAITVLLLLHWWGLTILVLFFTGTGDSGSLDSMLGGQFRWLATGAQGSISASGMLLSLAAWIGLFLIPSSPKNNAPECVNGGGVFPRHCSPRWPSSAS